MANENVIGIAMELDVSDLKSGLQETQRSIRTANKQFAAATSGMEDWSKSSVGLKAKLTQLNTTLTNQKKNVKGIEAELENAKSKYGENSEQVRKLKDQLLDANAAVGKTEKAQRKYTKQLEDVIKAEKLSAKTGKDVSESLKDISKEADKSSNALSKMGKVVGGIGGAAVKGFAGIGVATAGALTGFLALAESTREYREEMGKLETSFANTGKSTEDATKTYKALYGVLGDEGQAVEASAHLAELVNNEEDLAKWSTIASGVVGKFGDSLPIQNLTEASNETAKVGKLTGGLADALNWAGVNEEEFQKKLDGLATEQERSALITNTLNELYKDAGNTYKDVNKDIIASRDAQAGLTDAMAELGAIAEPIMTSLKRLATEVLEEMTPFVKLIGEGLSGALNGTEGSTDKLAEGLSGLFTGLLEKAGELIPMIQETILKLLPSLIEVGVKIIQELVTASLNNLPLVLNAAIQIILTLVKGLTEMLPTLIPAIVEAIFTIVDTLMDNLDQIIDAAIELMIALSDGLIEAIPIIVEKIPTIIQKLVDAFVKNYPKILEAGIKIIIELGKGLIKAIPDLLKAIPTILASLLNGFGDLRDAMLDVGKDLLKGIWQGIEDGAEWLKEKITGFAGNVSKWFKKVFKINSPSKLMEDEVGKMLGLGIGKGITDSTSSVLKDAKNFSNKLREGLSTINSGLSSNISISSGINGGGGVVSNVNNFTQVINSPKTPSRIELYRQTKNLLALKGGN